MKLTTEEKELRRLEINRKKRNRYLENREKHLARGREYRLNNIEKERERFNKYDIANKEKRQKYRKLRYISKPRKRVSKEEQKARAKIKRDQNYEKNSRIILDRNSSYRQSNPGKINDRNNRRRVNQLRSTPNWLDTFDRLYIRHLYIQAKELEKIDGVKYHVDHIIPLQGKTVCGLHVPWNLQLLEASINCSKSNKVLDE